MDPRYIVSALAGLLTAAIIYAGIMAVRHFSPQQASPGSARTGSLRPLRQPSLAFLPPKR